MENYELIWNEEWNDVELTVGLASNGKHIFFTRKVVNQERAPLKQYGTMRDDFFKLHWATRVVIFRTLILPS